MKIVFLTTKFDNSTGGTKYDKVFVEYLMSLGDDVRVIDDAHFAGSGNRHYYNKLYKNNIKLLSEADCFITNSRLYTRMSGILKKIRSSNPKIKLVAFHHHFNFMTQKGVLRFIHKKLELGFLNNLDLVIFASGYIKELAKKYVKTESYLAETVIDAPTRKAMSKSGNEALFIGNLERRKGISYLLEAFAQVYHVCPSEHLTLVGGGDPKYESSLRRLAQSYGLNSAVTFAGRITEEKKAELLNSCDFFVFPSLLEGLGAAIREAMSYGLPVIAFDNSAMSYTVKDKVNGILVKNKDVNELAKAIKSLFEDEALRRKLTDGALATSQAFYLRERFYADINKIHDTLVEAVK